MTGTPHIFAFNRRYFVAAVVLLCVEVLIALYVRDAWIRPYGGDLLVVILLFWMVKAVANVPYLPTAGAVLIFAYCIELLQHFRIVERLGLGDNAIASVVIGTGFQWLDMLCYTAGILIVILTEWHFDKRRRLLGVANG